MVKEIIIAIVAAIIGAITSAVFTYGLSKENNDIAQKSNEIAKIINWELTWEYISDKDEFKFIVENKETSNSGISTRLDWVNVMISCKLQEITTWKEFNIIKYVHAGGEKEEIRVSANDLWLENTCDPSQLIFTLKCEEGSTINVNKVDIDITERINYPFKESELLVISSWDNEISSLRKWIDELNCNNDFDMRTMWSKEVSGLKENVFVFSNDTKKNEAEMNNLIEKIFMGKNISYKELNKTNIDSFIIETIKSWGAKLLTDCRDDGEYCPYIFLELNTINDEIKYNNFTYMILNDQYIYDNLEFLIFVF